VTEFRRSRQQPQPIARARTKRSNYPLPIKVIGVSSHPIYLYLAKGEGIRQRRSAAKEVNFRGNARPCSSTDRRFLAGPQCPEALANGGPTGGSDGWAPAAKVASAAGLCLGGLRNGVRTRLRDHTSHCVQPCAEHSSIHAERGGLLQGKWWLNEGHGVMDFPFSFPP
jgi:hypothetical protein